MHSCGPKYNKSALHRQKIATNPWSTIQLATTSNAMQTAISNKDYQSQEQEDHQILLIDLLPYLLTWRRRGKA